MKYDIYYQNSAGKKLDLCNIPYLLETGDILDFEWDYTTSTNYNTYGGKINGFTKSVRTKKLQLTVFAMTEAEYKTALDTMIDAFEYDIINRSTGRLYVNGNYLRCYITAGAFEEWEYTANFMSVELTLTTEYPMWIVERQWNFAKTGNLAQGSKKYPNRYPYRYANGTTTGIVYQRCNSPANFQIVFNGPVADPHVIIDGLTYGLVNVDLEESEYAIIDSFTSTITKYCRDGTIENIYNNRTRENSVFTKLRTGSLNVQWTGEYLLSIVVFEERSMPRWS